MWLGQVTQVPSSQTQMDKAWKNAVDRNSVVFKSNEAEDIPPMYDPITARGTEKYNDSAYDYNKVKKFRKIIARTHAIRSQGKRLD